MAELSVVTDRVVKRSDSGCWEWQGAVSSTGYGRIMVGQRHLSTHRAAYELHCGPIPAGACVLHSCDNRLCVNPAHLSLGTNAENSRQMVERGRYRGPSRLSPGDRERIRQRCAAGETQRAVAADFGVSQGTVSNVVRGRTK